VSGVIVRPVRFTDDVGAMRRFLETAGLRVRIESERGGWCDMVAGSGMVALHDAASATSGAAHGETRLSFETDDVGALADQLAAGGVPEVTVHDEAYGQVLTCRDPRGDVIAVDGRSDDLYGYRLHRAQPDERLAVVPVLFTDPGGDYGGFLEALGLVRTLGDEYFAAYRGPGDAGDVGLHYVYDGELPIVPGPAAVHLTLATTEALEDVAARLRAAGHGDASITADEFVSLVSVTDPDGRECQIHVRSAGSP
jgi:hypothetical protein